MLDPEGSQDVAERTSRSQSSVRPCTPDLYTIDRRVRTITSTSKRTSKVVVSRAVQRREPRRILSVNAGSERFGVFAQLDFPRLRADRVDLQAGKCSVLSIKAD